jgi:undecaprenyl-diphosphatase
VTTKRAVRGVDRRTAALGVILLAGVASFAWIAMSVFAGATLPLDHAARALARQRTVPALVAALEAVTVLGSVSMAPVLVLLALAALWWPRLRAPAVPLLLACAGAGVLDQLLKQAFPRLRPLPFSGAAPSGLSSFPSGHALFALSLYGTLAWLIAARLSRTSSRACVWAGATFLILAIGLSRVCLGVHYVTDVLAGYAAGLAWVSVVLMAVGGRALPGTGTPEAGLRPTRIRAPR